MCKNNLPLSIDVENSEGHASQKIAQTEDIKENKCVKKSKPIVKYNYTNPGPFEVYMEAKTDNRNFGNLHNLNLAKKSFRFKI